ncbi:serine/threonine protein kinase [Pseudolysobacter antarcticus]|uniref:Serine/threonine protein kinase n=2 Tax=Pseudolysobacter antarcticus TaxID=2511995 RepID=A0A411HJ47_9GAMM|nr:serine/threonine protein kinase [Pseudolysobacter antarcticus]
MAFFASMNNDNISDFDQAAKDGDTLGRLRALFEMAVDLPASERAAWIDANVSDIEERAALLNLLAADDGNGFLDTPVGDHAARLAPDEVTQVEGLIGQQIGAFRILRLLGQGGMAAVFLGERVGKDFQQFVALKLLRRGLYSDLEQRLFLRERQVLAGLSHPHIASMIDGGVTQAGIPYLVMEYIDGVPITQYASEQQLDVHARVRLFLTVCRAVETAHRNLIVHRDIKPSNILVDGNGTVKLLDFGIAKLIEEDAEAATVGVFTPGYAAPEQVLGGIITTATDVYGLGVLLHELLLGRKPEGNPARRPSSLIDYRQNGETPNDTKSAGAASPLILRKVLRGDLDNIVLKALAAEPDRRYASAGALAEDIERFLDHRPVRAHPPSRLYRARKFIVRHRGGVVTTVALVLAIFAALGLALWQTHIARQEAARANAMRDFMFSAFEEAQPSSPRAGPPKITEVVEQAMLKARDAAASNPRVYAELQTKLGAVLRTQGNLPAARNYLQHNYDQARIALGDNDSVTLDAGFELLNANILAGDYKSAQSLTDTLRSQITVRQTSERAKLLFNSAMLANKQHDLKRALAESQEALQLSRTLDDAGFLSDTLTMAATVQINVKDYVAAGKTTEELLLADTKNFGAQHLKVASAHSGLSRIYRLSGDLAQAEEHIKAALAIDEKVLSKDDWRRANHLNALMMVQRAQRNFQGALETASETLRIDKLAYGEDQPETANDLNNVGMFNVLLGKLPAAIDALHASLMAFEKKYGAEYPKTSITRASYGAALAASGDSVNGEAELRHAIKSQENEKEPDIELQIDLQGMLARLKLDKNDPKSALAIVDSIDALIAKQAKPDPGRNANTAVWRATALLQLEQFDQAQQSLATAETQLKLAVHPDPEMQIEVPLLQAIVATKLGDNIAAKNYAAAGQNLLAAMRNPPSRLGRLVQQSNATNQP